MPAFPVESVARRAGASKATVYRHWPTPSALLVDAMDAEFRPLPEAGTGDLRADLVGLLTSLASSLVDPHFPKLMAAFTDAAERDPALGDMHAELTRRRREPLVRLLDDARARGPVLLPAAHRAPVDAARPARRRRGPRARGRAPSAPEGRGVGRTPGRRR